MTADLLKEEGVGENKTQTVTVIRDFGSFVFEEVKVAPTMGMSGKDLMFQPTISIKLLGIKTTSPHSGGT